MYTITDEMDTRILNGIAMKNVTIVVDTEDDIPAVADNWDVMSTCFIANSHEFKILNHEREWV